MVGESGLGNGSKTEVQQGQRTIWPREPSWMTSNLTLFPLYKKALLSLTAFT